MGLVEQSVVLDVSAQTAADAWQEYSAIETIGQAQGPQGRVELSAEDKWETGELVTFERLALDRVRVTLHAEYDDDDESVDVSSLRADVDDEIARFKEFIEKRRAA
jgi:hypothetical protein